jgi:guanine deaminase
VPFTGHGQKQSYYASNRHDAAAIGFDDQFIYDELEKPMDKRAILFEQIKMPVADELFKAWQEKADKEEY